MYIYSFGAWLIHDRRWCDLRCKFRSMAQSGFSGMIIVCAAIATLAFSSWQVVGFVVYGSGVQQCTVSNIFGPLVVWSETSQTLKLNTCDPSHWVEMLSMVRSQRRRKHNWCLAPSLLFIQTRFWNNMRIKTTKSRECRVQGPPSLSQPLLTLSQ